MSRTSTHIAFPAALAFALFFAGFASGAPADTRAAEAAKSGDWTALQTVLKQRGTSGDPLADGTTALHWAAFRGRREGVEALIRAGAPVDAIDDNGITPLALASANGDEVIASLLLAAGARPNLARPSGETPVMTAARSGSVPAVKALLAHGGEVNASERSKGQTALMWAIAENHTEVVKLLVASGADVNAKSSSGFTPLMFVAQQGNLDAARTLVETGADLRATDKDGADALIVAIDSIIRDLFEPEKADGRHRAVAMYLLERGADPNSQTAGRTPLHSAVWTEQTDLVKALFARGADPNPRLKKPIPRVGRWLGGALEVKQVGATPFWLAAHLANVPMMRLLVEHGADPLLASDDGSTPLMMAVGLDNYEGWERHGIVWRGERSVLLQRYLEAAKYSLELGGDVNASNKNGETALHAAALVGGNDIVEFLVSKGAIVNVKDKKGRTPQDVAEGIFSGVFLIHAETAELLKKLSAKSAGQ
jgi:ankyrin repeat protein